MSMECQLNNSDRETPAAAAHVSVACALETLTNGKTLAYAQIEVVLFSPDTVADTQRGQNASVLLAKIQQYCQTPFTADSAPGITVAGYALEEPGEASEGQINADRFVLRAGIVEGEHTHTPQP